MPNECQSFGIDFILMGAFTLCQKVLITGVIIRKHITPSKSFYNYPVYFPKDIKDILKTTFQLNIQI